MDRKRRAKFEEEANKVYAHTHSHQMPKNRHIPRIKFEDQMPQFADPFPLSEDTRPIERRKRPQSVSLTTSALTKIGLKGAHSGARDSSHNEVKNR